MATSVLFFLRHDPVRGPLQIYLFFLGWHWFSSEVCKFEHKAYNRHNNECQIVNREIPTLENCQMQTFYCNFPLSNQQTQPLSN